MVMHVSSCTYKRAGEVSVLVRGIEAHADSSNAACHDLAVAMMPQDAPALRESVIGQCLGLTKVPLTGM